MAREGRLDEAANHLHSALEYQGSFAPAHVLLAKVRAQQQRWEEAKESISRAVALAPEDQSAKQLAAEIEQAEHEAEAERLREARERRAGAERYLSACQRDVTRAFALGAGVATALALLVSWPGGGKRRG
jgi:tetratricopeptide (TPR) repeat protein